MRLYHSALIVTLLFACALPLRADVSPFPVWRVTANGVIAGAIQLGDRIVLGGTFTRLGRGVAPFKGFLDPLTLAQRTDPGCAWSGEAWLGTESDGSPRVVQRASSSGFVGLRDGAGPFVVGSDVTHVRIGADCRFDRHFAMRLPPAAGTSGRLVGGGGNLYAGVVWDFFRSAAPYYIAEFDGRTGETIRAWPVPRRVEVIDSAPGRLAVLTQAGIVGEYALGFFDLATGQLSTVRSFPANVYVATIPLGNRVLISWYDGTILAQRLEYLDPATWQPVGSWPDVRSAGDPQALATASGRLVLVARGITIGGGPERGLAAFDAATGAHDPSWSAPAWLDAVPGQVNRIVDGGSRLLVFGGFPDGAPRDTLAALDLTTGALDPWEYPFLASQALRSGPVVYLGDISSTRQLTRRHLAAVDARTGDLLDWEPMAGLPAPEVSNVTAIASHDGFVYAAQVGKVRRYAASSGVRDESWRFALTTPTGALAQVTRLAAGTEALYAVGGFEFAADGAPGPAQPRSGGAAILWSGRLTSWNPRLRANCPYGVRPPTEVPCIADIAVTADRVFLRGQLQFLDPPLPMRSFAGVTPDTGALDSNIPAIFVFGVTAAEGVLWMTPSLGGEIRLARVDPGLRATVLPNAIDSGTSYLAVRQDRAYVGAELDAATAAPTGNSRYWLNPVAAADGVLDIEYWAALGFYPDLTPAAPGAPTDLAAMVSASSVTLRWARAATDLQPLTLPPPSGGTAATSYVITASLAPGGPAIAQLDTASSATWYDVTAPPGVYFVRVQAKNAFGISGPSNEARVEIRPGPPDPPVATLATVTGSSVRVQWQAAPQGWPSQSYVLEAGSRAGASDIATVPVNGLEFRAAGLPPGRYYVRVRAVNANGTSGVGEEVVVEVR